MAAVPRTLHPALNPAGYMTAAGTVYAAVAMIYNAHYHHGVISTPVVIAAVAAVSALLTRQVVTPVADPRDGNGDPLITAPAIPAAPDPPSSTVHVIPADPPPSPPAPS